MSEPIRIDALRPKVASTQHVHWYGIYRGFGHTDRFVEELRTYLTQQRLTDVVCGVRLERRAQGEFYFVLTYATEQPGQLPDEISAALADVNLFKSPIGNEFELSELRRLFSGEVKVTALGHCLGYRQLKQEAAEDPFRAVEAHVAAESEDDRAERLLWYLSAVGHGRWPTLRATCAALGYDDPGDASRLARQLRLLGHLEVTSDGTRWGVTQPAVVIAPTPTGEQLRFATGARSVHDSGDRHPQRYAPFRLSSDALPEGDGVIENPAATLTALLPDVSVFAASLSEVGGVSPSTQRMARHDGLTFQPIAFTGQPGMYEVTARDDRTVTLFYDGERWRRGDWYGLRYLALRAERALLPLRFDAATWRMAIPLDQRLPEAYERVLVLSSGLVPRRDDAWWVYDNVEPTVANRLAERLEAPLTLEPT